MGGEIVVSRQEDGRINLELSGRWHLGAFWVGKQEGMQRTAIGLVPDGWPGE
jgi:hypothetical protein